MAGPSLGFPGPLGPATINREPFTISRLRMPSPPSSNNTGSPKRAASPASTAPGLVRGATRALPWGRGLRKPISNWPLGVAASPSMLRPSLALPGRLAA